MSYKNKGTKFFPFLDVCLTLILRNSLVPKVLHKNLLMFTSKIIFVPREFLHLDSFKFTVIARNLRLILDQFTNQVNSIPMLNPHEWSIHTLPQQRTSRFHIRRGHLTLQPLEIILTSIQGIVNHKLDKSFRLSNQLIKSNKRTLILDMQKLRKMFGRIGLFRPETLLAGVHLTEPTNGCLQWQLTRDCQPHLEWVALGIIGKHEGAHSECFTGTLAITYGHNVRVGQLHILLVHKQMHCHVQLTTDTKDTLTRLRTESVKWQIA
mmetsp:Transcript_6045/g.9878  ORF Transcript_6045/g.9878 Transcript_6045/m.9878 type:complete len:265 (-) Transcript_6045:481-1275(-)